jgi:hypothetical protein
MTNEDQQLKQRIVVSKAVEDADTIVPPPSPLEKRVFITAGASRTVPANIAWKLAFFTLALLFAPLLTYFYVLNNVFPGNSTYSAFTAVAVANGLVIAYVVVAALEEDETPQTRKVQ